MPAPDPLADAADLLAEFGLPASAPQDQLRGITRVAATLCGVPTAVVNLFGDCFQHQVGAFGFEAADSPLADSMCARAVRDPALRYVPDASREPAFRDSPWVDGRIADVRLYASAPLRLPDGRVLGSLCVFSEEPGELTPAQRDGLADLAAQAVALCEQSRLTARAQRLARQAEEREALVSGVLETIDVGVVACDADGRLTLFNRAAREMHGAPADPGVDHTAWATRYRLFRADGTTLLPPDEVPLTRALTTGEVHDAVMVVARDDAPPRTLRVDGRVLRDAAGAVLGAVVAQKDVTAERAHARQLTAARDAALAATEAKSAFLASVSHEIRTPLHGMLGMLELLLAHDLDDAQRERARVALTSGRTLLGLLDGVLDLSKGEALELRLRPRPVAPASLLRQTADAARGTAQLKGLRLDVGVAADVPPVVLADPDRLRQVLLNLLVNAVKFTDTGGVTVRLDVPEPDRLRLVVADTGPGIAADELGTLFTPFAQGAAGLDKGGTGLGLALCREIVDLMGGTIDVASSPAGTTFTVLLPLRTPAEPEPAAEPAPDGGRNGTHHGVRGDRPLDILLVDDDEVNRIVGAALLRRLGADVTVADSGDAALDAAARRRFDLVLLDRWMPGLDGVATARELRRRPDGRALPIVALTGAGEKERQACLDAGMDGFLTKPVDGAALAALLDRLPAPRPPSA